MYKTLTESPNVSALAVQCVSTPLAFSASLSLALSFSGPFTAVSV